MAKTVRVTCDGCGADITTRTNSVDYRLVLASENKPGYGSGFYTDMMIYPPIDHAHYFCRLECLDLWSDRRRHVNKLWAEEMQKWKEERGTKHENWSGAGVVWSYPEMPPERRKERHAAFEAEALTAFPMPRATPKDPTP